MNVYSNGQIMSWYHSKILRIPHGKQNGSKRYLTEDGIYSLFDGIVTIQEKVDGKLSMMPNPECIHPENTWTICEDITDKHTCHEHIIKYDKSKLPYTQRIVLDKIQCTKNGRVFEEMFVLDTDGFTQLTCLKLKLLHPTMYEIYGMLDTISKQPSHFGSPVIEGLVIKNYEKQLMGKWINDEFEDQLAD